MPANVYVFNLYNEPVTNLSVSGYNAGSINGYANGTVPAGVPIYTPASLTVPRSKTQGGTASFSIGDNPLVIPWDSFRGTVTVTIPDPAKFPISLDDPLILLLAVNDAILLTTRGYVVQTFTVALNNLAGEQVDPEPV
jgi:hypothetical protein